MVVEDDDRVSKVAEPNRVDDIVALAQQGHLSFDEAALMRAESAMVTATLAVGKCYQRAVRRVRRAVMLQQCRAGRIRAQYAALRKFAEMPQPVSRIEARLRALDEKKDAKQRTTKKFWTLPLMFALFRQLKRELGRIAVLKGSMCGASSACASVFEETAMARKAALERVLKFSLAPNHKCFLRKPKGCESRMMGAFEALSVQTKESVTNVILAEAGVADTLPRAQAKTQSDKLASLKAQYVACSMSRACKRRVQNMTVVGLFVLCLCLFLTVATCRV
jgi:hypothetical protein